MADQLQLRGGTTTEHGSFTGALREVTVDIDKDVLVVHDGVTAGGHPVAAEDLSNVSGTDAASKLNNQTVAFNAGAAATPSVTFNGDTNTGIYSPGADQLALSTNGTGRLFVDASGNVGVGTSPTTRFHVYQTGSTQAGLVETNQSASVINFKSTGQSSGQPQVGCAASDMILNTNGSERLRITSAGLVGIGTSSPSYKLDVSDDTRVGLFNTSSSSVGGVRTYADGSVHIQRPAAATTSFLAKGFLGTSEVYNVSAAGGAYFAARVGIGTTSPRNTLDVNGSAFIAGGNQIQITGNPGTSGLQLIGQDAAESIVGTMSAQPLVFRIASTERARIDSSGRLLVGTSSGRGPQIQLTEALGLQQAAMRTYSGTGDLTINLSGLRQVSGSAHRQAGGVIIYSGIQGNASNSTSIVCYFRVNGLSTYTGLNVTNIVGTANLTLSNAGISSCTLTLDVGDSVEGSAVVILTSQSGGHLS